MADAGAIRAGRAFVEMGVEGIEQVKAKMAALGNAIQAIGATLALKFGVDKVTGYVDAFAESAKDLFLSSRQLQMTTAEVQEMRGAARELGIEADSMAMAVQRSRQYIAQMAVTGEQTNDTMRMLGLTLADVANLSDLDRVQLFGERLKGLGNAAMTSRIGRQIFGRGGEALAAASGDLGAARDRARGGVMLSDEQIKQGYELSRSMEAYERAVAGVGKTIGGVLTPAFRTVYDAITPIVKSITAWVNNNKDLVQQIALVGGIIVGTSAAFLAVSAAITVTSFVFGGLVSAVGGFVSLGKSVFGLLWSIINPMRLLNASLFVGTAIVNGAKAAYFGLAAALKAVQTMSLSGAASMMNPMNGLKTIAKTLLGGIVLGGAGLGAYFLLTSEAAQKAFAAIGDGFGKLKETAIGSFNGISDAMFAGDLGLAWEVAISGMKVAWYQLNDVLKESIGVSLTDAFFAVRTAWAETCAFVKTAWALVWNVGENAGTNVANAAMTGPQGVDRLNPIAWGLHLAAQSSGQLQHPDVVATTVQQSNRAQDASNNALIGQLAEIEAARIRARNAIRADQNSVGEDADNADILWRNAVEAANIARAQHEAELAEKMEGPRLGLEEFAEKKSGAAGTFSSAALFGFGTENPMRRVERQGEQIAGLLVQAVKELATLRKFLGFAE